MSIVICGYTFRKVFENCTLATERRGTLGTFSVVKSIPPATSRRSRAGLVSVTTALQPVFFLRFLGGLLCNGVCTRDKLDHDRGCSLLERGGESPCRRSPNTLGNRGPRLPRGSNSRAAPSSASSRSDQTAFSARGSASVIQTLRSATR